MVPGAGIPQPGPGPGYGYPQPPGSGPGPGYGYPQPGPGYGPPHPPTEPGGFGPPAVPGPGAPAAPPGRRLTPLKVLLAGVVTSALIAAGFGGYHVLSGGDGSSPTATGDDTPGQDTGRPAGAEDAEGGGDPAPGTGDAVPTEAVEGSLVLEMAQPEVPEEDIITAARGAWVVGDSLVRVMTREIVSLDLAGGGQNWTYPLPSNECEVSATSSEHRIALLQGGDCEVLTVLDLTTGTVEWTQELDERAAGQIPAFVGDTVAIGSFSGGWGYGVSGQRLLWEPQRGAECVEEEYAAAGDRFLSHYRCGSFGDEVSSLRLTEEDGTEVWEWEAPEEYGGQESYFRHVLSVDPLIVEMEVGDEWDGERQLWVIDEGLKNVRHVLPYDPERHSSPCEIEYLASCPGAVAHAGMLYLTSADYSDNAVVAFDLATGTAVWEAPAISGGLLRLVQVADGRVLAYQLADSEVPGMVVAVDPEQESLVPVMALPQESAEQQAQVAGGLSGFDSTLFWSGSRFFMVNTRFYDHYAGEAATLAFE